MTSSITIPGAVFSSLVFHLKNAPSDSEGFLYGCMRTHHVENITDSQSSGTREEKKLYVESFVCFPERFKFYDHYGRPHTERIKAILGDDIKRVIGWFSYRRNTTNRPSMREKVIHRRLTNCFSGVSSQDFLFGLVTEGVVDGSTVHSTDYSFYNWIGTSLQPVKVRIVNLQVTATVPYQLFPLTPTPPSLPHYSSILHQHGTNFVNSEGHVQQPMLSEQLYKAILGRLKPLCESLSEAGLAVEREAREVEELERQLQELTTLPAEPPAEEPTKDTGVSQGDVATPYIDSDLTTMPVITPLTNDDTATTANRDHIEIAPLIDFEGGAPPVTNSSKQNGDVIDLTSSQSSSSVGLPNGDTPLLDLPNDVSEDSREKAIGNGDISRGVGEGREEEGNVDDDTATESVLGSQQELF